MSRAVSVKSAGSPGASVLERIVAHKRSEIAVLKKTVSVVRLARGLVRPRRSLAEALARPGPRFILECKKASPAHGPFRGVPDVARLAEAYAPFADAVSVLTDERFFSGGFDDIKTIRTRLPQPILCKDFVLDEIQIALARQAGADAVLLMLSVLDDACYARLAAFAEALGMDVVAEVHTAEQMRRAARLGAGLIGINNRNLATLTVSIGVTEALAPLAPKGALLISESGIETRADIRRLTPLVDGFLIGSALVRAPALGRKVRELVFGEVKICGLTNPQDAKAAYEAGAVFGGLVLVPGTPRAVAADGAKAITRGAPLKWVGVFRNQPPQRVAKLARRLGLAAVQLHGNETEGARRELRQLLPRRCEIWQAVPVSGAARPGPVPFANRVLLDTSCNGRFGGTGRPFDWRGLERLAQKERFGLAGGITPRNVTRAVATGIGLIDVGSGVEQRPGVKSAAKLKALFSEIRTASGRGPQP